MAKKTKEIIMEAARKLFNQKSFNAVSLHELAQQLNMSRGNLAYHFKDKDILLAAIADEMWISIEKERNKSRALPSFENLHNEIMMYFKYQKEYAFIFLDVLVINHPMIVGKFREMIEQTVADNKATIAFSLKTGNMNPEPVPGTYSNLAFVAWMIPFYWLSQKIIRGDKSIEDGEKVVWSLLVPHFSEKGKNAFKKFFGDTYYISLGASIDKELKDLLSF